MVLITNGFKNALVVRGRSIVCMGWYMPTWSAPANRGRQTPVGRCRQRQAPTPAPVSGRRRHPAPMIQPGERTGEFNIGQGDAMIGQSISAEDYAIAAVNEIDSPTHLNKRFAVAN